MQLTSSELMRYRDIVLELRSAQPGLYTARVAQSPGGETGEFPLRLDISPAEIEEALASVTYSSGNYLKRSNLSANYDPVINLGDRLLQGLLRETHINRLFRQAQEAVQSRNEGLRLRVAAHDSAVFSLPWEFLFDATQSSFLALSLRTPLVRQWAARAPVPLKVLMPPLRVLVVTAEVADFGAADEIASLRQIETTSSLLQLEVLENVTFAAFKEALGREPWHLVHFIGTGAYGTGRGRWTKTKPATEGNESQGLLFMGADEGRKEKSGGGEGTNPQRERKDKVESAEFVPPAPLAAALREDAELRFVFLNGCDTDRVAAELSREVPAVLGMRNKVLSWTCQTLTRGLYEALVAGQPLEAAVTAGRQAIDRQYPGTREWGLPTFFMSAPEGNLLRPLAKGVIAVQEALVATAESSPAMAASSPPAANLREQRRLQSLLEIETRNLDSLRAQQATLGDSTPEFIKSQVAESEQKVSQLQEKLGSLATAP